MIVPGGGISLDCSRCVSLRPRFLLPVRVFSKLFRGLMLAKLLAAHQAGQLQLFNQYAHLAEPKAFARYLAPLGRRKWRTRGGACLSVALYPPCCHLKIAD